MARNRDSRTQQGDGMMDADAAQNDRAMHGTERDGQSDRSVSGDRSVSSDRTMRGSERTVERQRGSGGEQDRTSGAVEQPDGSSEPTDVERASTQFGRGRTEGVGESVRDDSRSRDQRTSIENDAG